MLKYQIRLYYTLLFIIFADVKQLKINRYGKLLANKEDVIRGS
jgi:hypothetical protein